MSTSTAEEVSSPRPSVFRWPSGSGTVTMLVLTALAAAGVLGSVSEPLTQIGARAYVAWPVAAVITLVTVRSAASFARTGPAATPDGTGTALPMSGDLGLVDPPMAARFRQRMGHWGTFVAGLSQFVGMVSATGVIALVVAATIRPSEPAAVKATAVGYLLLLLVARRWCPEPRRRLSVALLVVALLGLVAVGVHLIGMGEAPAAAEGASGGPDARDPVQRVLGATALLPLAFLPLMRMGVMVTSLPASRRRHVRRWVLPLTAAAAAALGMFVEVATRGVVDPSMPLGTAFAHAVSGCPTWVGLTVRVVTVVLGTTLALMLLDDIQAIGGRQCRLNAVRDVFTPPPGRRIHPTGETLALTLVLAAIAVAPSPVELLGFSAFCVLVLFGSIHVAVMRPSQDGRHRLAPLPLIGLGACLALVFSLPPEAILAGVALISVMMSLRALFVVASEPLRPDIVERGEGSLAAVSAAAPGRAEDAPGDLPADHGAGRAEHRAEG